MPKRSNIFYLLLIFLTFLTWLWLLGEFFTKGATHLPTALTTVYLIILTFYASDKEFRRWRKNIIGKRPGEVFVYGWLLTLILLVAFYWWYGKDLGYFIPGDLLTITGSVLIIFIVTDYLKEEHRQRKKK